MRPRVAEIQYAVAGRFRIKMSDMVSRRRARCVARPRQVAMYLSRQLTSLSLPQIGRHFGDRDHTTVMHACRVIETLRESHADLDAAITEIIATLSEEHPPI